MHEIRSNEVADVVQTVAQSSAIAEGGKRFFVRNRSGTRFRGTRSPHATTRVSQGR
jgi:hypothetical protein